MQGAVFTAPLFLFILYNMKLVSLDNFDIKVEDELLLYPCFRKVYKADKTKSKNKFLEFISILYFTYDLRSDYQYIVDEKERLKEVCVSNGLDVPKFSKDELECIKTYKDSQKTSASLLLEDTRVTIDKIREMLRNIDFNALEEKDKITALKTTASTVAQIPKLIKDLVEAEKAVTKEIQEQGRARGQGDKTLMDDGILL